MYKQDLALITYNAIKPNLTKPNLIVLMFLKSLLHTVQSKTKNFVTDRFEPLIGPQPERPLRVKYGYSTIPRSPASQLDTL